LFKLILFGDLYFENTVLAYAVKCDVFVGRRNGWLLATQLWRFSNGFLVCVQFVM